MKDQDICDVILANSKGKAIQVFQDGKWNDEQSGNNARSTNVLISYIAAGWEYRVKPKAREWNLSVNEHGTLFLSSVVGKGYPHLRPILVREVLED